MLKYNNCQHKQTFTVENIHPITATIITTSTNIYLY